MLINTPTRKHYHGMTCAANQRGSGGTHAAVTEEGEDVAKVRERERESGSMSAVPSGSNDIGSNDAKLS